MNFREKEETPKGEEHYRVIKWSVYQGNVMTLTVSTPHNQASKHIKQMLTEMKGKNIQILYYT